MTDYDHLFVALRKYPDTNDNETAVYVGDFLAEIDKLIQKRMEAMEQKPPLLTDGKSVLAPPHPSHFGIPEQHWEAAHEYAKFWHEIQRKRTA